MNNKMIGERIKAARKAKGLSQEQLGEKLDISFQAVSSWETGKFIPDSDHLPALAKALDLSLDSLFAEEDRTWELKPINYDFGHMFTFVKGRARGSSRPTNPCGDLSSVSVYATFSCRITCAIRPFSSDVFVPSPLQLCPHIRFLHLCLYF